MPCVSSHARVIPVTSARRKLLTSLLSKARSRLKEAHGTRPPGHVRALLVHETYVDSNVPPSWMQRDADNHSTAMLEDAVTVRRRVTLECESEDEGMPNLAEESSGDEDWGANHAE